MLTDLTEKLNIVIPIIQAPMAGVSTPSLAAAVSNAGALGSLSVGAMDVEEARSAITEIKAKTIRPFNVNVFCHQSPAADLERDARWLETLAHLFESFGRRAPTQLKEIYLSFNRNEPLLELLLEERPAVVSFHFGLPPTEYVAALKAAGIALIATATNIEEAQLIGTAGLDAVIAQGYEAGGHRGVFDEDAPDDQLGTLALTRLFVQRIKLPVISAGGIMDGAGIAAALALGAQAAQLGTAFISCPDSAADEGYRKALQSEAALHTVMTRAISGRPARGMPNGLTRVIKDDLELSQISKYPLAYDAAKALHAIAKAQGSGEDFATRWAGQSAGLSRAMPAAELVEVLRQEILTAVNKINRATYPQRPSHVRL